MTAFDYDTAERYARSHPDTARAFQLLGDGITITSPTDGQVLTYNSTTDAWENQTPSTFSDTFTSIEVDGVPQSTNAPTLDFDGGDFTLTESPTDSFDIVVNDSGIDHNATTNYDANQHIDHSSLSVVAGAGLTGGGTMIASRTVDVGAGTGITVNADDVALSAASQASLALADTATQPGDNVSTLTIDIASADLTDGTNIALLDAANTFTAENTFSQLIVGDPGLESTGITVAGTTYDGVSKISDIGSGTVSMLQIHRHSTTVPPNLVFSLSHSNTSAHTVVSSGDSLMQLDAVGHDGTDYAWGGRISFVVDGTPGNNDMPTRFEVDLSQDGTQNLTNELTINADGSVAFACASGTFTIGGTQAVVQGDNVSDLTVDIASTDLTDTSNLLRKDTAYQIINPATGTGNYLSVEDTNSTSNIYFRLRDAGTNKHTYLMRRGSSHATAADDVLFQSYDGTNWLNHYLYDDSSNIAYLYGGTYASASWKIALDNATGIKFNDNVNGGGNALTNITGNISLWTNDSGYFDASSDVDHGGVGGLTDDDHTQYSLISSQSGAPSSTPGRVGEVNIDTSSTTVYVSTGTSSSADWTAVGSTGGALSNVVEDTTPQLGGDLDTNGHGVTFPSGTVTDTTDSGATLATKTYIDLYRSMVEKNASYTVTSSDGDKAILFRGLSAGATATLPALSGVSNGFRITFYNLDQTYNLLVAPNGTDTLMGTNATVRMLPAGLEGTCQFVVENSDWKLVYIEPQPYFEIVLSAAQTISASTWTTMQLNNTSKDPWGFAATGSYAWYTRIPGEYWFHLAVMSLDNLTSGQRIETRIMRSGSSQIGHNSNYLSATGTAPAQAFKQYPCSYTDYFQGQVWHNNSTTRRIWNSGVYTFLVGQRKGNF